MRPLLFCIALGLVAGCDAPQFITDAPVVHATSERPEGFTLPARFAVMRKVYGSASLPSQAEAEVWAPVLDAHDHMGSFHLWRPNQDGRLSSARMMDRLRDQRFNYLLVVEMEPHTGAAKLNLYDVASGQIMATTTSLSDTGARGFWGGRIRNPSRLARVTTRIAERAVPELEALLEGVQERANR